MKNGMSTFKISMGFTAILTVASMLVACNRNNTDNSGIPAGYNPNAMGCATGTYYTGGQCYNANGTAIGAYNGINFISDNYQYRNFNIKDSNGYRNFLKKAMGVCDRAQTSAGIYSCSSWTSGYAQVVLQTQTGTANHLYATFSSYPYSNGYSNWGVQLPSVGDFFLGLIGFPVMDLGSAIKNPLTVDATISVINKSQGFEARGYGDLYTTANTSLIQIMIPVGKLEDAQFDYQLAFEGVIFATGRFVRY
ncbi:MAG: hypothetical protein AABY64_10140 [Bdellovibrionota bacterium]